MSKSSPSLLVSSRSLIIVPHSNSFVVLLVSRALIFAILVMSLDILLGFTGLASLGQAAYLGVGAYLTAILATNTYGFGMRWDFWLMVPLGMICRCESWRRCSACSPSARPATTS